MIFRQSGEERRNDRLPQGEPGAPAPSQALPRRARLFLSVLQGNARSINFTLSTFAENAPYSAPPCPPSRVAQYPCDTKSGALRKSRLADSILAKRSTQ